MGFTDEGTDLQLQLFDGSVHAFKQSDPTLLQVDRLQHNTILVRDVSNRLDLEANDGVRGDREMGTCEMMEVVRGAEYEVAAGGAAAPASRRPRPPRPAGPGPPRRRRPGSRRASCPAYCTAFDAAGRRLGTARPDSAAQPADEPGEMPPGPAPA